jgi:hypothetical protein
MKQLRGAGGPEMPQANNTSEGRKGIAKNWPERMADRQVSENRETAEWVHILDGCRSLVKALGIPAPCVSFLAAAQDNLTEPPPPAARCHQDGPPGWD